MSGVLAVDAVEVTKRYGDLVAVDGISVQVGQGEVYGVLGPNGAGKTTFMRMLFGLIRPDAGEIRLFGRTWAEDGTRILDNVAGFVETPRFYPYLTGRENLAGLARLDVGVAHDRVDEVLEIVELEGRADDRVRDYSYGMVQRLGLAASLLRRPQLLIVDEPANGLDPAGIRDMRALIKRLAASGLTVLLSSHDMAEVEEICDNVTIMREGSVVFHGEIAELRAQAPEQGHRISTDDDERALEIARTAREARGRAGRRTVAWSCAARRTRSIGLCALLSPRGWRFARLELSEAPLETLFFMLTESHSDDALVGYRGRRLTMSTTEVAPSLAATGVQARRPGLGRALGFELGKLFKQKRAPLTLAFAAVAPILIVIILKGQQRPPKDSLFGRYIHQTGWSVPLLILGFAGQWVLPLLTALVAGDIFAGEDQMGTWKTVLTRSVSRTQIFWAKTITAVAFALSVLVVLTISTIISSVVLVGHQPLVGLTGQVIPSHTAALLVSASWATAIPPLLAFTCFAILLSVLSRNPAFAIAAPVVIGMVMQLTGSLGGVEALRPFLLTTPFEAWHGLLAETRFYGPLVWGAFSSAIWCAGSLTWAFIALRRRDVTGG